MLRLNPAVMVFLNESETTVKPRLALGSNWTNFGIHGINEAAPISAAISELRQAIATQHERLDITIARGVDVFCASPEPGPRLFLWLVGLLREALATGGGATLQIRLHYLATLSESREEIPEWVKTVENLQRTPGIQGGGAYLVSDYFRGIAVDRLRSYPILARAMQTMALTGASRPATTFRFSEHRTSSTFGVYAAGLESYRCYPFRVTAEYFVDSALWLHMLDRFSELHPRIAAYKGIFPPSCIEHWLLKVGETSAHFEELAQSLKDAAAGFAQSALLESLALDVTRSTTNATLSPPRPPALHAFERLFMPFDDAVLRESAWRAASALLDTFPLPLHPFFIRQHPSRLNNEVCKERARACDSMVADLTRAFRTWAFSCHSEWLPPNTSEARRLDAVNKALRLPAVTDQVFESCHLDPLVSRDSREELCAGLENIQFLHLMALSQ